MTPGAGERDEIRAAMERILGGTSGQSDGAMTVVALAIEAGSPATPSPSGTPTSSEFYQRVKERGVGARPGNGCAPLSANCARTAPTRARTSPGPGPTSRPLSAPSTCSPRR
jgi:hypothetical protein